MSQTTRIQTPFGELQIRERGASEEARRAVQFSEGIDATMQAATGQWAQSVVNARLAGTANYPAPPTPRKGRKPYVRTGHLGDSWHWRHTGSKANVVFWNTAAYAVYVVGTGQGKGQAWMHRGRWWLMRERIHEEAALLGARIQNRLDNLWRKERVPH